MKVNKKWLKKLRKLKQYKSELYIQPKTRRLLDTFGISRSSINPIVLKRLKKKPIIK